MTQRTELMGSTAIPQWAVMAESRTLTNGSDCTVRVSIGRKVFMLQPGESVKIQNGMENQS